jgi:uncharacterized membrane protein YuzA (DUF378 family)
MIMNAHRKFAAAAFLALLIIGGLNWGLVGGFSFDLVAAVFGVSTALSRIVYILVGLSALWHMVALVAQRR